MTYGLDYRPDETHPWEHHRTSADPRDVEDWRCITDPGHWRIVAIPSEQDVFRDLHELERDGLARQRVESNHGQILWRWRLTEKGRA